MCGKGAHFRRTGLLTPRAFQAAPFGLDVRLVGFGAEPAPYPEVRLRSSCQKL